MSIQHRVPEADTRPTDRRGGEEIEVHRVECPYCEKGGVTNREVNRCGKCGHWFEVDVGGDD